MDKLPHNSDLSYPEQSLPIDSTSTKEEIDKLIGIVRRQYPIIAVILAGAIALGLVYLFTTPKQYTAHAMFLIDTTKIKNLVQQPQIGDRDQEPLGDAEVDTEIEVLKSEQIGLQVVKDLKLTENPEFASQDTSASQDTLTREALGHFIGNRTVSRVALTYVLDIAYTSLNPETSAAVA